MIAAERMNGFPSPLQSLLPGVRYGIAGAEQPG